MGTPAPNSDPSTAFTTAAKAVIKVLEDAAAELKSNRSASTLAAGTRFITGTSDAPAVAIRYNDLTPPSAHEIAAREAFAQRINTRITAALAEASAALFDANGVGRVEYTFDGQRIQERILAVGDTTYRVSRERLPAALAAAAQMIAAGYRRPAHPGAEDLPAWIVSYRRSAQSTAEQMELKAPSAIAAVRYALWSAVMSAAVFGTDAVELVRVEQRVPHTADVRAQLLDPVEPMDCLISQRLTFATP